MQHRVEATPKQIVDWFIKRWQVEVTFEESRRHLGVESNNAVFVWNVFVNHDDGIGL